LISNRKVCVGFVTRLTRRVPLVEQERLTLGFKDIKGAIRIRISKKNRQHTGQKKKYKRTNNDLQNNIISTVVLCYHNLHSQFHTVYTGLHPGRLNAMTYTSTLLCLGFFLPFFRNIAVVFIPDSFLYNTCID
jgi:hypothetical protein